MGDAELIEFAREFREGILDGGKPDMMCAAVCWPLAPLLRLHGVECVCREATCISVSWGETNHIWIELADGRALDPTLDQFIPEIGPVYLGKPMQIHRGGFDPDATNSAGREWSDMPEVRG